MLADWVDSWLLQILELVGLISNLYLCWEV